jgi:hypothetical protein
LKPPKPNSAGTNTEEFLALARDRFRQAAEAETELRAESLEDLKFRAGEQWPKSISDARDLDKRPCLTINRLPQFLKQVTNEQRQNRPSVQVNPVGDGADVETAEVLQGVIRHIELNSSADAAYDTAFEAAATMGFGYFRIVTEFQDEKSFDQEILIKRVKNPFTVYFDPACQEPDYSDARYCFIVEDLTHDEFREQYPDSELAGLQDFTSVGDGTPGWITQSSVRIAEYFHIEREEKTLALLQDGSIHFTDEVPEGTVIVKTRKTHVPSVKWSKINACEIIAETEWAGKWIPVVPVLGDEIDVDGAKQLVGMVRYARDPQRMYNYWASAETEMIALAPRAPFIGAEGQFENHEAAWKQANTRNLAYLEYNPKSIGGQVLGAPQRNVYEPPVQAITHARMQAADDLKSTTGIYDASLGANGNEKSGKAILARQKEGDNANFHFTDNLTRSIKHCGRILIDLIPHIYDAPRVIRIIGEDQQPKTVQVNQHFVDEQDGVQKIFDLTSGKYDVTVSAGPSYQSKRTEAVESMMELTKAYPPLVQIAGDLLVKNMDWPGAQEIADRLHRMLPPQLQDQQQNGAQQAQQQMQQAQQQLQMLGQQHGQLVQTVHTLQNEIDAKTVETQSRERIVAMQEETKRTIALATLDQREGLALLEQEIATIRHRLDLTAGAMTAAAGQQHDLNQQALDQQHQAGMQDAAQQHAAEQAEQAAEQAQLPKAA